MSPEPAPLVRRTPAFLLDQVAVVLLVVPPALAAGVPVREVVSPGQTRQVVLLALILYRGDGKRIGDAVGDTLVVWDRAA